MNHETGQRANQSAHPDILPEKFHHSTKKATPNMGRSLGAILRKTSTYLIFIPNPVNFRMLFIFYQF